MACNSAALYQHECVLNIRLSLAVTQAETPKPTEGLEYTFIRKPASNPIDRKELANLWELSGSQELSQEIFTTGNILGPEQVDNRDAMGSTSIANLSLHFHSSNNLLVFR